MLKNESTIETKGILALKEEYEERIRLIHVILNMNEVEFNSKIYGMRKEPKEERRIFEVKRKMYSRIIEDLEELLK